MLSFRFEHKCLLGIEGYRKALGGPFFSNRLPENKFTSVLAVQITVVKYTYLPSSEKCHVRQLENGYFSYGHKNVYKEGERVKYVCSDDYYTEHENGQVTCTKDDWSPPPRCIRKSKCAHILLRFLATTNKSVITSCTLIHHYCLVTLSLGALHLKHNAVILSVSHAALMSLCAAEVSRYINMQNETL